MIKAEEKPSWIKSISKALTLDEALEEYAIWEKSQSKTEEGGGK